MVMARGKAAKAARTAAVITAALLLVLLLVVVSGRRPDGAPPDPVGERTRSGHVDEAPVGRTLPSLPADAIANIADPGTMTVHRGPLIDRVEIVPPSPCRNENVEVRVVSAGSPEAHDAKVFIRSKPGNPAVLRFAAAGSQSVHVVARSWSDLFDSRHVTIPVRNCDGGQTLSIVARRAGNSKVVLVATDTTWNDYTSFAWDFGDGTGERRGAAAVEHDYSLRDQTTPTSTLVVRLSAESAARGRKTARVPLTFVNAARIAMSTGAPTLPVSYDPFADIGAGLAHARLRIRNILRDDIDIESAELAAMPCAAGGEPLPLTLSAGEVLDGGGRLRAGAITPVDLRLPLDRFGQPICRVQVWLRGPSKAGPVRVSFALETGVQDDAVHIRDRARAAEIVAASAALGRDHISPTDLVLYRAHRPPAPPPLASR